MHPYMYICNLFISGGKREKCGKEGSGTSEICGNDSSSHSGSRQAIAKYINANYKVGDNMSVYMRLGSVDKKNWARLAAFGR